MRSDSPRGRRKSAAAAHASTGFESLRQAVKMGDNLLVLADADDLLARLGGEPFVRLALIDPPYNRRTRFHHYSDTADSEAWLQERVRHATRIRDLLTDEGSLWMHLDDSELHYCKVQMDRVFGRENFIGTIVWQKTVSRDNRTPLSTTHEYLLAYARRKRVWHGSRNLMAATTTQLSRYRNPDNDPRGPWTSGDLTAKAGPGRRAAQFYDVVTPTGRRVRPSAGTAWRFTRERFEEFVADNRIYFGNGARMPRLKRFLSDTLGGLVPNSWWPASEVGTADTAKRHLKRLFPDVVPFDTPKPEQLARRIVEIASDPGDYVLDVYAGSGTTPAVAHKLGRRWVAGERERTTFATFLEPRLRRVAAGRDPGGITTEVGWLGGGTFVVRRDPLEGASDLPTKRTHLIRRAESS